MFLCENYVLLVQKSNHHGAKSGYHRRMVDFTIFQDKLMETQVENLKFIS